MDEKPMISILSYQILRMNIDVQKKGNLLCILVLLIISNVFFSNKRSTFGSIMFFCTEIQCENS